MAAATLQSPEQQNPNLRSPGWDPSDAYIDLHDTSDGVGSTAWVWALDPSDSPRTVTGRPSLEPHPSFRDFGADKPTFAEARQHVDWTRPDEVGSAAKAEENLGGVAVPS